MNEKAINAAIASLDSLCDGSNWPEEAQSGLGYQLYTEIAEQLGDISANLRAALPPLRAREEITDAMVDMALSAWFASPPSETDQGLERSMRAALVAALSSTAGQAPGHTDLMVAPESIDAFMEANPLPDEPIAAEEKPEPKAKE